MSNNTLNRLLAFDRSETAGLEGWAAGVDEAGRGPLAGPVVAAAVILFRKSLRNRASRESVPDFVHLDDSKKVLPPHREKLFREIACHGLVGIGVADENEIDQLNIFQATRLAMKRAVLGLSRTPEMLLIDGLLKLDLPLVQKRIVQGDQKSASIAAASIMAKVYRDAWMRHLDQMYPDYLFHKHKGYGTPEHLERIRRMGPSPVHRRSFAPVWEALVGMEES